MYINKMTNEQINNTMQALCLANERDPIYIKRRSTNNIAKNIFNKNNYYIDKYITSLIRELVMIQMLKRHLRDIQSDHIAIILNYDIIGSNSLRHVWKGCQYGTHAEVAALQNLPYNFSKRTISLDMLVIRSISCGQLRNSKPCFKCIKHMNLLESRRYCIRKIYYSDDDGNIICENFKDLLNEENKYLCKRNRNAWNKF